MRTLRLTVRRSIAKTFLLGFLGLPFIFVAIDYVWGSFGFLDQLGAWAYAGGEVEAFEARDDILVAMIGLIGLAFVLFALKEFVSPRRLLVADDDGIHVPLRGPLRGPDGISWYQIRELRAEGAHLLILLAARGDLPSDPWNARWDDETTLRLRTTWWDRSPENALGRMKALGFKPLVAPTEPPVPPTTLLDDAEPVDTPQSDLTEIPDHDEVTAGLDDIADSTDGAEVVAGAELHDEDDVLERLLEDLAVDDAGDE